VSEPRADRPAMPGYGVLGPGEGTGLLPWSWAEERLTASRYYWVSTVRPDGRPHASPVWGLWHDGRLWFSCGGRSRKARNLAADPRCSVTTDDAENPVIVDGVAEITRDPEAIARFVDAGNAKYGPSYTVEFLDPDVNLTVAVRPERVFGLLHDDFPGSPTRWTFGA
jgi:PPOX class probable F420-dependent enzyme